MAKYQVQTDRGSYVVETEDVPSEQPGIVSRGTSYVRDTLRKTAENMNLEHPLAHVAAADRALGQGDLRGAGDELKQIIPDPAAWAKGIWDKLHSGDISGVSADILPVLMMKGGPEAIEGSGEALGSLKETAGTAVRGAVQGIKEAPRASHGVALAAGAAGHFLPGVGVYKGMAAAEAANMLYQGSRGAAKALRELPATKLRDAEIAEVSARADARAAEAVAARAGRSELLPAAAPVKQVDPVLNTPRRPGMQPSEVQVEPTEVAAPAATQPAAPSPAMLDGIAQFQAKKPYAKLTPTEKAAVDSLAAKLQIEPPAAATPPSPKAAPVGHQYQTISPIVQKLINKEKITMEDLGAPDPNEPKAPRAVEPDDYSSMLEQSLADIKAGTLRKKIEAFSRKKSK